jgi:geranylgeranyl diphosphate synthase, type II
MAEKCPKTSNDISVMLQDWADEFQTVLEQALVPTKEAPSALTEAMLYTIQNGGKRIRPFIVTRICELCGGTAEQAKHAAIAIECVHTFSLVHDDLPAMDNDDWRRGRPSCHKAYGEAVAILAGDALLVLAFEILATQIQNPAVAAAAAAELARACGRQGMCGGQTNDILSEGQPSRLAQVQEIHRYKTARLFECAARLGAICAEADADSTKAAAEFGRQLGLAFQIADDLLDVTGSKQKMGKSVAKDQRCGKQTYPAAVGIDASRQAADEIAQKAIRQLKVFGPTATDLENLTCFVVQRNR